MQITPAFAFSLQKICTFVLFLRTFSANIKTMKKNDIQYLDQFELKLEEELVSLCSTYRMLDHVLLASDDINDLWHNILAPEYIADAVREVAAYPVVSVAWAAYLGMGVARGWDTDWERFRTMPYANYYGEHKFDDMDEHIVSHILGLKLDSPEARQIEDILRTCGEKTIDLIRYERIEPQSAMAFHIFARACKSMFRIGAALELYRLGYKFQKVNLSDLKNPAKLS